MGLLSLTSEELRYKMKHLGVLCPNRSVANDDEDELPENLIGGLSVANRVESIQNKIELIFKNNNKGAI